MLFGTYYIITACVFFYVYDVFLKTNQIKWTKYFIYSCFFLVIDMIYLSQNTNGDPSFVLFISGRYFLYPVFYFKLKDKSLDRIMITLILLSESIIFWFYRNHYFLFNVLIFFVYTIICKTIDLIHYKTNTFYFIFLGSNLLIIIIYELMFGLVLLREKILILVVSFLVSVFIEHKKTPIQIKEKSLLLEDSKSTQFKFDLILNIYSDIALFEYDKTENVIWTNKEFCQLFELSQRYHFKADDFIMNMKQNIYLLDNKISIFEVGKFETKILTKTFKQKWIRYEANNYNNKIIGAIIDITTEKEKEMSMETALKIDELTGFYSRYEYKNQINKIINNLSIRENLNFYLIDLDNFRSINERYGHNIGDDILKEFSNRLIRINNGNMLFVRIAGDEFGIIEYSLNENDIMCKNTWEKINSVLLNPIILDEIPFELSCSCGVVFYKKHALSRNQLIEFADFALSKAKKKGKESLYIFDINEYNELKNNIKKVKSLDNILKTKNLFHVFQPIVCAKTGEIEGYEALMRVCDNPLFINIQNLFETAYIHKRSEELEKVSVEKLFNDLSMKDHPNKKLFINYGTNFCEINNIEKKQEINMDIVYELTEYSKLNKVNLEKFKKLIKITGESIAIDDFGSGYSNEISLLEVQPDFIKIDIELIRDIDKDLRKKTLVKNIVQYAHMLNIKIVAEGVETSEELKCLINLDVDFLQGYYLGRPAAQFFDITDDIKKEIIFNQKQNENKEGKEEI